MAYAGVPPSERGPFPPGPLRSHPQGLAIPLQPGPSPRHQPRPPHGPPPPSTPNWLMPPPGPLPPRQGEKHARELTEWMAGDPEYRSDDPVFRGSASPPLGGGSPTPKCLTSRKVPPGFVGNSLGHNQKGDKNREQTAGPSGQQPRNSRFDRDPRTRSWSPLIQEDPLNVQQIISTT